MYNQLLIFSSLYDHFSISNNGKEKLISSKIAFFRKFVSFLLFIVSETNNNLEQL